MYNKWIEWLEEIDLDCRISALSKKMREKKIEIYHHKHVLLRHESIISQIRSNLYKAKLEWEDMDLDLSLIDGRFQICDAPKEKKHRAKSSKTAEEKLLDSLKRAPLNKRLDLLEKLLSMEKDQK